MPHDLNGKVLAAGDRVLVPAIVESISATDDYCNLMLKSVAGRKPDGAKETISLNAAVVQKDDGEDTEDSGPADPNFTVAQGGEQQGAWIKQGDATLAAVYKCHGQPGPYVCIYPHTDVASVPYAMHIDDNGQVMLQLPPTPNRAASLILSMDKVVALIEAALPIQH